MGFAYAWLSDCAQASHDDHMAYRPPVHTRRVARVAGRARYRDDWHELERRERPQRFDEDSEPEADPSAM